MDKRTYLVGTICLIGVICYCILAQYNGTNVLTSNLLSSIPVLVFLIYIGILYLLKKKPITEICFWILGAAFAFFQNLGIYFLKKSEGISLKPVIIIFILAFICCTCLYANIFGRCYQRISEICIHYNET